MATEVPDEPGLLFQHQPHIPRLPLPSLSETCSRYLKVIEPLASDMEKERNLVKEFEERDGPELQKAVEALDQENSEGSWLSGFWETMYLEFREPQPINTNPFFVMEKMGGDHPIQVTAAAIRSIAAFHHRVRTASLPPARSGGSVLCSYQYPRLLASARIPGNGRDRYMSFPEANHIILNVGGHLIAFNVMTPEGRVISQSLCEKALKKALKDLMEHNMTSAANASIPYLTTLNRDEWYKMRSLLEENNSEIFQTIDSAIAVFCLSEVEPADLHEASRAAFLNRAGWFDKLQVITLRNGQLCFNMEHTATDGHALLALLQQLRSDLTGGKPYCATADDTFTKMAKPTYLNWEPPAEEEFANVLEKAQQHADALLDSVESNLVEFKVFGSNWIKSMKVSPDAFMQLSFQLTYHRIYNEVASTYESVMMKKYLRGRTETGRTLTSEMKEFVEAMGSQTLSIEDKDKALRAAAAAHVQQIADCQAGKGVDRHLWVMKHLAFQKQKRLDDYEIPDLFTDETYTKLCHIILSTSTCTTEGCVSFGFGPVTPDGFGLGYAAEPERLAVFVTSFQDSGEGRADLFARQLKKSFLDMYAILEAQSQASSSAAV